jgi:hypothetical protein
MHTQSKNSDNEREIARLSVKTSDTVDIFSFAPHNNLHGAIITHFTE